MLFVSKIIACNGAGVGDCCAGIRNYSRIIVNVALTSAPVRTRSPLLFTRFSSSSVCTTKTATPSIFGRTYVMNLVQRPFTTSSTTTTNQDHENQSSSNLLHYTDSEKKWKVYLSGEIHTNWRDEIATGIEYHELPIELSSPILNHVDSDDCGAYILGMSEERPVWDAMGAKMNAIRTQTFIKDADIVIVKFGEQYRQWNAAYDVGYAAAHNKSLIIIHPPSLSHMLKEVNASANVVCTTTQQAIDTLHYVIYGELPSVPKDGDQYIPIANRLGKGNPNP
jgi:YtoQ family protein